MKTILTITLCFVCMLSIDVEGFPGDFLRCGDESPGAASRVSDVITFSASNERTSSAAGGSPVPRGVKEFLTTDGSVVGGWL